jgi:hypothetical protein
LLERKLGMGRDGCVYLVQHQINGVFLGYYALKKVCYSFLIDSRLSLLHFSFCFYYSNLF